MPRRRRARPLDFTKNFTLYKSSVDIQEVADTAKRRCQIGAALAAGGFTAVIASVAPALPLPALAMLGCGAMGNSYALAVVAQRLVQRLAARHVERILVVPLPEAEHEAPKAAEEPDKEEEDGFASLLFDAATMEERFRATRELRLEVRTGTADRWFSLVDPPTDEEVAGFAAHLGEGAEEGEAAAQPAPLADLFRLGLLRVNLNVGTCGDQALLDALLESPKVAIDERLEARPAAGAPAPAQAADGGAEGGEGAMPPAGELLLSEMTRGDVQQAAKSANKGIPPAEAIQKLGRRALCGGISVLMAGGLFMAGESARDADGVPRWKNLNLPM